MTTKRFDRQEANTTASCFFRNKKMLISACSIMKDEMLHVEQWLRSVRIFADEIIVADTGYTDGTREYLQQQDDVQLITYKWDKDFSRAKNTAWAKAQGKWVAFLDADEAFYHPENLRNWLEIVEAKADYFDTVMVPIHNVDADKNDRLIGKDMVPRIFRNHARVRYIGAVHEQPAKEHGKISIMLANDLLAIRHTGYSSSIIRAKHQRNLPLMLAEYENSNTPEKYCGFLAECCFGLGKYEDALKFGLEALHSDYRAVGSKDSFYRIICLALEKLGLQMEDKLTAAETDEVCENALNMDKWLVYVLKSWLANHSQDSSEKRIAMLKPIYFDSKDDMNRLLDILEIQCYFDLVVAICKEENIARSFDKDMQEAYRLLENADWQKLWQKSATNVLMYSQVLTISLLEGSKQADEVWYKEKLKLLPMEYRNLLECLMGISKQLTMDFVTYRSLLEYLAIYGSQEMLEKYLALSAGLSGEEHIQLGDKLLQLERYEQALQEYAKVQQGDEAISGAFWLSCGKCLYFLHEYPAAMEAMEQATAMGCENGELEAYMAWCKDKLA